MSLPNTITTVDCHYYTYDHMIHTTIYISSDMSQVGSLSTNVRNAECGFDKYSKWV